MSGLVQAIYRYPVKGLSPEKLSVTQLRKDEMLAHDRRYAIENGPSGFDPASPKYRPKSMYLMLMRNERLAALQTHFDEATTRLTIRVGDREAIRADLSTPDGRLAVEAFFRRYMPKELRGAPKVLEAHDHRFSDVAKKVVSIINLASVAALETSIGAPVDPLRFRGNVLVESWPAWHEFELVGKAIRIGERAQLKVIDRIVRCAATNVDPATGIRDLDIPRTLMRAFGHNDCGVYARVIEDGLIAAGDRIEVVEQGERPPFL